MFAVRAAWFFVFSLGASSAGAEPAVRALGDAFELPKTMKLEGRPVARLRYEDITGIHIVVVTETEPQFSPAKTDLEDGTQSKKLFAYAFKETTKGPKSE